MKSNVTQLKPRQGSYEEALELFGSGDFRACVDSLNDSANAESAILQARGLIRLGDAAAAVGTLEAHAFDNDSHEIAAEALAVKSYALHVLKRSSDAAAVGIEARARCYSSGLVGIEAELLLAVAIGNFLTGDFDAAETVAIEILNLVDDSPSWVSSKSYAFSLHFWRARACDIRGLIEMLRSNYAGQASWVRSAFQEFDKSGVSDEYIHATLLANLADTAITLGKKDIIDFVIARAENVKWSASLVAHEFRVFSALAEASSASGDQLGALRFFRRCLDCAPSQALQIRASVERARLLHEIGESFSAREEIDHAVRLSRSLNWEEASELEQRQLLFLAAQVAKYDAKHAEKLLGRYDTLTSKNPTGVAIKDERFRGEEFMARATVLVENGHEDRAVILLIDALQIFTASNLDAKAGLAAVELARLTAEPRYVDLARKQCDKQPNSILARKMARFDGSEWQVDASRSISAPVIAIGDRPKLVLLS